MIDVSIIPFASEFLSRVSLYRYSLEACTKIAIRLIVSIISVNLSSLDDIYLNNIFNYTAHKSSEGVNALLVTLFDFKFIQEFGRPKRGKERTPVY